MFNLFNREENDEFEQSQPKVEKEDATKSTPDYVTKEHKFDNKGIYDEVNDLTSYEQQRIVDKINYKNKQGK